MSRQFVFVLQDGKATLPVSFFVYLNTLYNFFVHWFELVKTGFLERKGQDSVEVNY